MSRPVMPNQTGPYADAINTIRKYVFSTTLENAYWNNSTLIRDDAARRWGCAEKLQRDRLAVVTASGSPAD